LIEFEKPHPKYKSFFDWLHEADVYMKFAVVDRFNNWFKRVGKDTYRKGWNVTVWRKWTPSNRYTKRRFAEPYTLRSAHLPFSLAKRMIKAHPKQTLGRYLGKFKNKPVKFSYVSGNWDIYYAGVQASFPDIDKQKVRMLEFARLLEHLVCDDIIFNFKRHK